LIHPGLDRVKVAGVFGRFETSSPTVVIGKLERVFLPGTVCCFFVTNGGAENIGFAIPVNEIKTIVESVKESGKIIRPWLGVRYVILNKEIAAENSLSVDYGALIVRGEKRTDLAVIPGSPADRAGLMENDIIL